jgi:hypothetical protein
MQTPLIWGPQQPEKAEAGFTAVGEVAQPKDPQKIPTKTILIPHL